jgi:copper chaperone CopZ
MQTIKTTLFAVLFLFTGVYTSQATPAVLDSDLKTIEIKVKGITCGMEPGNISKAVTKLEGVESCELKGKAKAKSVFVITYDESKVSKEQISKAVEGCVSCEDPSKTPYSVLQ